MYECSHQCHQRTRKRFVCVVQKKSRLKLACNLDFPFRSCQISYEWSGELLFKKVMDEHIVDDR